MPGGAFRNDGDRDMQQYLGSLPVHAIRILPLRFEQSNYMIIKTKATSEFSNEEIILSR